MPCPCFYDHSTHSARPDSNKTRGGGGRRYEYGETQGRPFAACALMTLSDGDWEGTGGSGAGG